MMLTAPFRERPGQQREVVSFRKLRLIAFIAPVAFAVGLGLFSETALEPSLPSVWAHVAATAIVAAAALAFTISIFELIARMQERLQRMARLEERQRIAAVLHDEVIQSVYGVELGLASFLDGLDSTVTPTPGIKEGSVNEAIERLDDVIARVRQHILQHDLS